MNKIFLALAKLVAITIIEMGESKFNDNAWIASFANLVCSELSELRNSR